MAHSAALFDLLAEGGYYWHIWIDVVALFFVFSQGLEQSKQPGASHLFY